MKEYKGNPVSVAEAFQRAGKPVCVCGELGGDKLAAAVLIGLGMRKLSMRQASVAQTKKMITGITVGQAEILAKKARELATAEEVETYLKRELRGII